MDVTFFPQAQQMVSSTCHSKYSVALLLTEYSKVLELPYGKRLVNH